MIIVTFQLFFYEKFKDFAQQTYFEVLGLHINAIKNRFEQEDYKRYIISENLLLKHAKNERHADGHEINNSSEFQRKQLPQKLEKLFAACQVKDKDFSSLLDVVKQMNTYEKERIPQAIVNISITCIKCFK